MSASSDTSGVTPLTNRVQVPTGARPVLATHNAGKLAKLRQILMPLVPGLVPESVISAVSLQTPEPAEDGLSFADNALFKARALAWATGLPAVADGSGLCVDALGGASGIFSARWSDRYGDDTVNLQLLLDQLGGAADPHRSARLTCMAVLVRPASGGQAEQVTAIERSMEGRLVRTPQGERSFGYDPILASVQKGEPGGRDHAIAQMMPEEKRAISHRRQIFHALAPILAGVLAG